MVWKARFQITLCTMNILIQSSDFSVFNMLQILFDTNLTEFRKKLVTV